MNIIFAGTPVFAERHLQALLDSEHNICAVYTQPDRPAGRGKKLMASPVKQLAQRHGLRVIQPLNFKDTEAQAELAALKADIMIVVAYGLILPKVILESPRLGCINVHGSILPRWRGAAPIQRAIQAGDAESGVTIMQMDVGLDTGAMLLKASCPISARDNSASLHDKLCDLGPPALLKTLALLAADQAKPETQDDAMANYASKIEKAEARLDWHKSVVELDREIRAFNPFPICFAEANAQRIKIHQASIAHTSINLAPAELRLVDGQWLVGCRDGVLAIEKVQMPGKKAMLAQDYLNGTGQTLPTDKFEL